jgi:hypothetical protein
MIIIVLEYVNDSLKTHLFNTVKGSFGRILQENSAGLLVTATTLTLILPMWRIG